MRIGAGKIKTMIEHFEKEYLEQLRRGWLVRFVNPRTEVYQPCPQCSSSELVEVRAKDSLSGVMCHMACESTRCSYVADIKIDKEERLFSAC